MPKKSRNGDVKVEKIQKDLEEVTNQLKRALADYHNLERRVNQEKESLSRFSAGIVILKFLPILDNLKKAAEHLKDDGLSLIVKQFEQVLKSEGVTEVPAVGQTFDPKVHEAVEVVEGDEDNKVVKVIEAGYLLNGAPLRPAKVVVVRKDLK